MGDAENDNRQKTKHAQSWGQVGWALGWRHTTANSTSSEFIIYTGNTRWSSSYWGRGDIVILRNRRIL
jgi:uncharacterized membrane protein